MLWASQLIVRPNLMAYKYCKPKDVHEILLKLRIFTKKNQEIYNLLNNPIKNIERVIGDRFCDSRSTGLFGAAVALKNCSAIIFVSSHIKN
jgi:hypothetical protein